MKTGRGLLLAAIVALGVCACSSGSSGGSANTQANTLGFNATCKLVYQIDNPITGNTDTYSTWAAAQADANNINNQQVQGDAPGNTYGQTGYYGTGYSPSEAVDLTISIPSAFGSTPIGSPVLAVYNAQGHQLYSTPTENAINQTVASGASMNFSNLALPMGSGSSADKSCSVVGDNLNNYNGS